MADSSQQPPLIELAGVTVYAQRDGTHVTGRVVFPYEVYGRTEVPIDYHSTRPDGSTDGAESKAAAKAAERLRIVKRYQQLCAEQPDRPAIHHARRLAGMSAIVRCGVSTIRTWAKRYELEGESALRDYYVKTPKKVGTFDAAHARDAVLVCGWWAFRIGNLDAVTAKSMTPVVALFTGDSTVIRSLLLSGDCSAADLIAIIDYYYAYPCDRRTRPFKQFGKWLTYDLTKWGIRAANDADYRRAMAADRNEPTPLRPVPDTLATLAARSAPDVPDARTRIRDTRSRHTTSALQQLAVGSVQQSVHQVASPCTTPVQTGFEHVSIGP